MSASVILPAVQRMIDNPGIYICSTHHDRESGIVIWSVEGELIMMQRDFPLDPTRFHKLCRDCVGGSLRHALKPPGNYHMVRPRPAQTDA